MSHAHSRRAACFIRFRTQLLQFDSHLIARGVTAVGVGSSALLGACHFVPAERPSSTNCQQAKPAETATSTHRTNRVPREMGQSACVFCAWLRAAPRKTAAAIPPTPRASQIRKASCILLPNVKDEPRAQPARRVLHHNHQSIGSFCFPFDSTRRDGCGRWL